MAQQVLNRALYISSHNYNAAGTADGLLESKFDIADTRTLRMFDVSYALSWKYLINWRRCKSGDCGNTFDPYPKEANLGTVAASFTFVLVNSIGR